jgi:general secretion pathway protein D
LDLGSGFSYALIDGDDVLRALLDALAEESKLKVLSSPQVLVIDNQTAKIKVADEVPIATTDRSQDIVTTSFQYRDAGVVLEVSPRINSGGLVTLELSQEVTDVGTSANATIPPPFFTRSVTSKVAAQSGETIVLGGLITDARRRGRSGIPGLSKVPVVGALFSTTTNSVERSELIVLLTPRVVENQRQARAVTEELKQRLKGISMDDWRDWALGSNFEGPARRR